MTIGQPYAFLLPLLRRYPLNSPRVTPLRWLPDLPPGLDTFNIKDGLKVSAYYDGGDIVSKSLFWFGDFDPWITDVLCDLVRPGDTVFDVGANIGAVTLMLARQVTDRGRVFAFEPIPATANRLRTNLLANGFSNVIVDQVAVSASEGTVEMAVTKGCEGMAIVGGGNAEGAARIEVRTCALDAYVSDLKIDRIAACKIDVEGHEECVFAGMEATLEGGMIDSLVFERHLGCGAYEDKVMDMLVRAGYQVMRILKRPTGFRLAEWGHTCDRSATMDFVAVRRGSEAADRVAPRVVNTGKYS